MPVNNAMQSRNDFRQNRFITASQRNVIRQGQNQ